jgi:hypothetical protein
LFRLYGGAAAIDDRQLQASVALGSERTLEQDPTFAFRILVDIAIKALSPAINDPTTAVLAIDQLHRLLRHVGLRHVSREEICDEPKTRLVFGPELGGLCAPHAPKPAIAARDPDHAADAFHAGKFMQTLPPHRHSSCASSWIC